MSLFPKATHLLIISLQNLLFKINSPKQMVKHILVFILFLLVSGCGFNSNGIYFRLSNIHHEIDCVQMNIFLDGKMHSSDSIYYSNIRPNFKESIYFPLEDEINIKVEIPKLGIVQEQKLGLDTVQIVYLTFVGRSMEIRERDKDTIKGRPNEIIITPFAEHHLVH